MIRKTVDLSTKKNLDIKSITMRAVNGDDYIAAASRCVPPDGGAVNQALFSLMLRQQLMIESIVEVDGKSVQPPYIAAQQWSKRTIEFVSEIYDFLNSVDDSERTDFQKELSGATSSSPATPAS